MVIVMIELQLIALNSRGLNFMFEAIFVIVLFLSVVLCLINFNSRELATNYLFDYTKICDVLIIFSNENTTDVIDLKRIIEFAFPDNSASLYIDGKLVFGVAVESKNCLKKSANILVSENKNILMKRYTISVCK